jgi:GNAT superfamily N-acetyltransferase
MKEFIFSTLQGNKMTRILRTDSDNNDFVELVKLLDAELAEIDGDEHAFYAQFNKLDKIKHTLVVYTADQPVACGALKEFEPGSMEIKRMYTLPSFRGKGFGSVILKELEKWAAELSYKKIILETGKRQPDAIALYTRNGYCSIPNYGQYAEDQNSVCFQKELR